MKLLNKPNKKKYLTIGIVMAVSLLAIYLFGPYLFYRHIGIQRVHVGEVINFSDTSYDLSFSYPKTWEFALGYFYGYPFSFTPTNTSEYNVLISRGNASVINTKDELLEFVRLDAEWESENYGAETIAIELAKINSQDVAIWKLKNNENGKSSYTYSVYFPKYGDTVTSVWKVQIFSNKEITQLPDEVNEVLSSMKVSGDAEQ